MVCVAKHYKHGDNIIFNPDNYKEFLEKFPKLKMGLAHFDDNAEWENYLKTVEERRPEAWVSKIINMIIEDNKKGNPKNPNLYVDISYAAYYSYTRT